MSIFSTLGFTSDSKSERLYSGEGIVYERTIAIGEGVIVLANIGTMRLIDEQKTLKPTLIGIGIAVGGLVVLSASVMVGVLAILAGGALAIWNLMRRLDIYLSLGTSDGNTTVIISKNRRFLHSIRDFLRHKIDTGSHAGATINISNSTLEGNFAMGDSAHAEQHETTE
nr:DUF6232 family protein [uncultured Duganella sp.]